MLESVNLSQSGVQDVQKVKEPHGISQMLKMIEDDGRRKSLYCTINR